MREEQLLRLRSETGHVVERRLEALLLPEPLAGAVREPVRLVTRASEEEHRGRVALQRDRVLLTREVDAINERLAHHVLLLLRERDDRKIMEAEIARGGERDRELAAA